MLSMDRDVKTDILMNPITFVRNSTGDQLRILYVTFVDYGHCSSGSSVRPHMMLDAFLDLGHKVHLLEGFQNKRSERRKRVKQVIAWLDHNRPDFCYVEPPTGPFFNSIDLTLLRKVNRMGIPIGLFYRDAYWMFPDLFPMVVWKRLILKLMHKRDLRLFEKVCDLMYFPSSSFSSLFSDYKFRKVSLLPPGGNAVPFCENNYYRGEFIYVGGTSESCGGLRLIEVFRRLNQEHGLNVSLTFITHSAANLKDKHYQYPWLNIQHTFDRAALESFYHKATYALIPRRIDAYTNLAQPLKLYEYLGYGIPIISTSCHETSRVITEGKCGLLCDDDIDSMISVIKQSLSDEEQYLVFKNNAVLFGRNNRWLDRALTVVKDLGEART